MFSRLASILACAALAGPLAAAPAPTIPVAIHCFRYAPNLETVHLRSGADTYQLVELSTANIVGPNPGLVDNGAITLHREEKGADGKTTWPLVARVTLPAECPRALVLLMPGAPDDKLPYRGLAMAHTSRDFPLGSMKFVNLSVYAVRGAVGQDKVFIPSGKVETFRPTGEPGDSLPVLFEYQRDDRWQRMTATRWALRDDRRQLICIYEDPATGRMNLRSIPDRTEPGG
ncbi:MAG: hypothetical protein MUF04_07065 [Akkermansiaceae bacterium]|jgi:hypothetical protein|nr:hypothetical protein [Akkermansiaceae bacterium]